MTKKQLNKVMEMVEGLPPEIVREICEAYELVREAPTKSIKKKKDDRLFTQCCRPSEVFEAEVFEIADSFYFMILNNLMDLGCNTRNLDNVKYEKWMNPIRLMIKKDGVTKQDFRDVWEFLKGNDFWTANIQSTEKLRKHFPTLQVQAKTKNNETKEGTSDEYKRKVLGDLFADE